jgi:hypothetical protein
MSMHYRKHFREMAHRERLAMIERGLVPPPEVDPAGFERHAGLDAPMSRAAERSRSVGVIMIGLGLAFMVMVTFASGSPETGIGIGGAFAVLGAAFLYNSTLMARHRSDPYPPRNAPQNTPTEPPRPDAGA